MKARLVYDNGIPQIEINGKKISSVSFRSFWPRPDTTANMYNGGVRLMSIYPSGILCTLDVPYSQFGEYWLGEGVYDWDGLRAQIDQFLANAPDAYLSLIAQLDTRDWFLKEHPECPDSFKNIATACCYRPWRDAALRCLRDTLEWIDREYPEKLYAVYVCSGSTCEWINREVTPLNPLKEKGFKQWTGDDQRRLPTHEELAKGQYGALFGKEDQNAIDYWRFMSSMIADTLEEYAHAVKEYNPGLLVGCFSGYSFAFATQIAHCCHLTEHRIAASPDVDIVFSPASYKLRGLENVSNSQLPMASLHYNGKMYYHEIDNTAFPSNSNPYAQVLQQYAHRRHASLRESIMYARRESARVFAELGTYWWFDMFGGWYDDEQLQRELDAIGRAQERLYSRPIASNAQVAFVMDEQSHMQISSANALHEQCVEQQLEALGRMGCMVDYLMSDDLLLPNFPREQYKLYIFPDLVAPTDKIRQAVKELREMGASVLFLYAPGILRDGEISDANMLELTGLKLTVSEGKQGYALAPAGTFNDNGMQRVFGGKMDAMTPNITAEEADEYIFARGLVSGKAQMAVKERENGGFDAWIAQGPVPEFILRPLARQAGVHIWQEDSIPVYSNSRMVTVFDHQGGRRELNVPWQSGRLEEMYTGETHEIRAGEPIWLTFEPDECKCFIYLKEDE